MASFLLDMKGKIFLDFIQDSPMAIFAWLKKRAESLLWNERKGKKCKNLSFCKIRKSENQKIKNICSLCTLCLLYFITYDAVQ
jgi:hypothetical protein